VGVDDKRTQAKQIVGWIAPHLLVDLVDELVGGLCLLARLLVIAFVDLWVAHAGLHRPRAGVGFTGVVVGHACGWKMCFGDVIFLCGCIVTLMVASPGVYTIYCTYATRHDMAFCDAGLTSWRRGLWGLCQWRT